MVASCLGFANFLILPMVDQSLNGKHGIKSRCPASGGRTRRTTMRNRVY